MQRKFFPRKDLTWDVVFAHAHPSLPRLHDVKEADADLRLGEHLLDGVDLGIALVDHEHLMHNETSAMCRCDPKSGTLAAGFRPCFLRMVRILINASSPSLLVTAYAIGTPWPA